MAQRNPAGKELGLGEGHALGQAVRHGDGVGVGGAAGGQQVARQLLRSFHHASVWLRRQA